MMGVIAEHRMQTAECCCLHQLSGQEQYQVNFNGQGSFIIIIKILHIIFYNLSLTCT